MAGVTGLMRVGKKALHFALLLFTAFWLVATSRPRQEARPCFVELQRHALVVALGEPRAAAAPTAPSCQGVDGLAAGSQLQVRVGRAGAPPRVEGNACWRYDVSELTGPRGLQNLQSAPLGATVDTPFFDAEGQFSIERCTADYRIRLVLDHPIREGNKVDVLHPTKDETWRIRRLIRVQQHHECPLLVDLPNGYCQDDFEVRSVTHAP